MSKNKRRMSYLVAAVLICLALVLTSCSSGVTTPTPTATNTVQAKYINVGVLATLSGFGATWGLPALNGFRLFEHDFNAAGGIKIGDQTYLINVIAYDNQGSNDLTVSLANKLITQDKVSYIYAGAYLEILVAPISTQYKVILNSWPVQGYLSPDSPYLFYNHVNYFLMFKMNYDWLQTQFPDKKRVAMVTLDSLDGRACGGYMQNITQALNMTLIDPVYYPASTTDFYPVLTPLLRQNPDIIETSGGYGEQSALIVKAARELGYKGLIMVPGLLIEDLVSIAGKDNLDNVYNYGSSPEPTSPDISPAEKAFYDRYVQFFGDPKFATNAINFYTDAQIYTQAVAIAQSLDTDKVVSALHNNEFTTLFGSARYFGMSKWGVDNQFPAPLYMTKVVDGQYVPTVKLVPTPDMIQ